MATYSFLDVTASIIGPGGAFAIGSGAGVAEEGITIERESDKDTMLLGADGSVIHSLHAAKAGQLTVRLLKTSPTNSLLAAMYDVQSLSSALWGENIISVRDIARGDATVCRHVAFRRFTGITYAKDGNVMEWAFNVGAIDSVLGIT